VVGLIALLLGCSPAWLTGRQVVFDFHSNRYAMPAMFGASLMIVAVVDWLAKGFFQKVVVISILVGLSIGYQLRVENDYANIWSDQLNFYWQLYWRAPYIQPKTALVAEDELFPNQGLFSTSAAVNLIYPQPQNPDKLAYWVYSLNPRYTNKLPNMENTTYSSSFRTLSFTGVMPNSLVLFYNSDRANCLWILTPEDQDDPEVPALTKQFLKISNLNLISPEPVSGSYPPRDLYGAEPNHSWCYYYQKADLARQQNDWDTVEKMADAVRQLGYSPEDNLFKTPHEWLVFIEGYVHANRWNDAQKLAIEAGGIQDGFFKTQVCGRWKTWTATTSQSPDQTTATAAVNQALGCSQ
jgi:hypothetical protein